MIKVILFLTKLLVTIISTLLFASCNFSSNQGNAIKGNGVVTTENRKVATDFTSVKISKGIEATIEQSNTHKVIVQADENLQKHILTTVKNKVLEISLDTNIKGRSTKKVSIKLPKLKSIKSTSGATVNGKNNIKADELSLDSSSGSQINISVQTNTLYCEASSGSQIEVNGKTGNLQTNSSSAGVIDAKRLTANHSTSKASSGSTTEVHPVDFLEAKASSGASVRYYNDPKSISKHSSSGGTVSKR